jgi:hypothetical protein
MYLFQPFFHGIKALEPFGHALGSCCVDVCTKVLLPKNRPILNNNMRLE